MRTISWLERLLWVIAVACFGYGAFTAVEAKVYARQARQIGEIGAPGLAEQSGNGPGNIIGRIEIPALGLTAPITRDYDVYSLRKGVGHIPTTAEPGGLGTVGLAGHRDSFFRPLRRIAPKMEVRLIDRTGTYHYIVDSTEVVTPDQVRVLDIAARPELALITCFPFDYIGAAPRRFVVHAHLLSVAPDAMPAGKENRQ
jgi:sortase A